MEYYSAIKRNEIIFFAGNVELDRLRKPNITCSHSYDDDGSGDDDHDDYDRT
jgi:hypothetical protein